MPLPRFDTDAALSKRAKYIGVLPWLARTGTKIRAIASREDEPGVIVACVRNHGLKDGDKIYLAGMGPTENGFYHVVEHSDPSHKNKAFYLSDFNVDGRLTPESASVYGMEDYNILDPDHLPVSGALERRAIEAEEMEIIGKIAPEEYQRAVQGIRNQVLGNIDAQQLQAQATILLNKYGVINEELSSEIAGLLIQKEVSDKTQDIKAPTDRLETDALKEAAGIRIEIQCREIELLCGMPSGQIGLISDHANAAEIIGSVAAFVRECIAEARKEASAKNAKKQEQSGQRPKTTPKKAPKQPAEPTQTNAAQS